MSCHVINYIYPLFSGRYQLRYTIFHVKNQNTLTFMKLLPAWKDFSCNSLLYLLPKILHFNLTKPNLFKYFGLKSYKSQLYKAVFMKSYNFHSFLLSHWHNALLLKKAEKSTPALKFV